MRKSKAMGLIVGSAVLAAAATLSGCTAGKYGSVIEPEDMAAIIRGQTTKTEVVDKFGDPDKTADLGGGKEKIEYIRENVGPHGDWFHSNNTAFWLIFKNNIVDAYGEYATDEEPKRSWWPSKRIWVQW